MFEESIQNLEYNMKEYLLVGEIWKKACVYGGKENVWIWFSLGSVIIISEAEIFGV